MFTLPAYALMFRLPGSQPDRLPAVSYGFEQKPGDFDWRWHHVELYRYLVIRHTELIPANFFRTLNAAS